MRFTASLAFISVVVSSRHGRARWDDDCETMHSQHSRINTTPLLVTNISTAAVAVQISSTSSAQTVFPASTTAPVRAEIEIKISNLAGIATIDLIPTIEQPATTDSAFGSSSSHCAESITSLETWSSVQEITSSSIIASLSTTGALNTSYQNSNITANASTTFWTNSSGVHNNISTTPLFPSAVMIYDGIGITTKVDIPMAVAFSILVAISTHMISR